MNESRNFGHNFSHLRFPAEEIGYSIGLTWQEVGFLQLVRDYCALHDGLPNDDRVLERIRNALNNSKQKVAKFWEKLRPLFTLEDGKFHFTRDQRPEVGL